MNENKDQIKFQTILCYYFFVLINIILCINKWQNRFKNSQLFYLKSTENHFSNDTILYQNPFDIVISYYSEDILIMLHNIFVIYEMFQI